jgi:hypothetical protein
MVRISEVAHRLKLGALLIGCLLAIAAGMGDPILIAFAVCIAAFAAGEGVIYYRRSKGARRLRSAGEKYDTDTENSN